MFLSLWTVSEVKTNMMNNFPTLWTFLVARSTNFAPQNRKNCYCCKSFLTKQCRDTSRLQWLMQLEKLCQISLKGFFFSFQFQEKPPTSTTAGQVCSHWTYNKEWSLIIFSTIYYPSPSIQSLLSLRIQYSSVAPCNPYKKSKTKKTTTLEWFMQFTILMCESCCHQRALFR